MYVMATKEQIMAVFEDKRLAARAVAKALVILYKNQTDDEQRHAETKYSNSIGFTSSDARFGTRCAKYFIKNKNLQPWMVDCWLKPNARGTRRISKYWRQLLESSNK